MEGSAFLHCSSSEQLRGRMRGVVLRRTAPGKNGGCGGQRDCRRVRRRWHSPAGRGQTPTGRIYHLGSTKTTQVHVEAIIMCNDRTTGLTCTHASSERKGDRTEGTWARIYNRL